MRFFCTDKQKQNRQRDMDKLFRITTGKTNPPRQEEEQRARYCISSLKSSNSEIKLELHRYLGFFRR